MTLGAHILIQEPAGFRLAVIQNPTIFCNRNSNSNGNSKSNCNSNDSSNICTIRPAKRNGASPSRNEVKRNVECLQAESTQNRAPLGRNEPKRSVPKPKQSETECPQAGIKRNRASLAETKRDRVSPSRNEATRSVPKPSRGETKCP